MSQKDFTRARQSAQDALLASPEIAAFVAANFPDKQLNVFREIDPGNLPPANMCPFVAFGPFTHGQAAGNSHAIEHAMPMGVFLEKSGDYVDEGNGGYHLAAADLVDEFAGLAENIVTHALLLAGFPCDQDEAAAPDGVDWSAYFMSFYTYRVRTTRRITL